MRIALVHDYLVQGGGAEKVLECFTELFPHAPIYTIVYDKELMHGKFSDKLMYTSYLQSLPLVRTRHRIFPPLMPSAIEQFDFSKYDVVLSDSSSFAKGIITKPNTLHICYMHTPMRYAWDDCQKYTKEFYFPRFIKRLIPFAMNYIRIWDKVSADRPDVVIANSNFIARRIEKYYHRESHVIHPPVAASDFFVSEKHEEYYLIVSRLMKYKRHDIVIEAFNKLGLPLKISGRGPELRRLKKIAGPTIEFLGRIPDEELPQYYANCKGFIFPQEEDFGIVAIEAMVSGRPLIAYRGGDIPEHMEEGKTGVFFDEQTPEAIIDAVRRFEAMTFDSQYIRSKALKFDREIFKAKIKEFVEKAVGEHKKLTTNN